MAAEPSRDCHEQICPGCRARQTAWVFPAIRGRASEAPADAGRIDEGQASCFFHAEKPAAFPCDSCGRFLCSLCDLVIGEGHFCTVCFQAAKGKRPAPHSGLNARARESLFLPQNLAMLLAFYAPATLAGLYVMFLTAPAAVYVSIRYWKHPGGIQRRGRWRFAACALMGLAQIVCVIAFAVMMVKAWNVVMDKAASQ